MSSRYLSTEPSVCCTTSASISLRPSALSAIAQSIVSATPGGFARSSPRSSRTKAAASEASRSGIPGTRRRTIAISRSIDGWPIQWKSARRLSASWSSLVRLEVRITLGRRRAAIVPSSGIVIWKSESTSSRNASNSSSARSISSISSTTGSSLSIASRSGRRMRYSGPKSSSSRIVPSCAARMWSSWRG